MSSRKRVPVSDPRLARRARFVDEYPKDHDGQAAAIRAGYSRRSAKFAASHMLRDPKVAAALAAKEAKLTARVELSIGWVLERLKRNAEESLDAEERMAANRALELIGKHLGMFVERVDVRNLDNMSDAELEALAAGRIAR